MFKIVWNLLLLLPVLYTACQSPHEDLTTVCHNSLEKAADQYRGMSAKLAPNEFPRSYAHGELQTSGSGWWCSGFYPGTLLYLYEETGKDSLKVLAVKKLEALKPEQFTTTTHDLGFMMNCSFGNAYRLDPKQEYKEVLINSARSLSSRYDSTTHTIRSWDSAAEDFLVIIDNMMNLELLFKATEETGDSTFYRIAVMHANTTMKNHFRPDYSSYHVLNYDPQTGKIRQKKTAQGYSDESAWARGQMWGLYGFTVVYRFTRDPKYLEQARQIADFILHHPNLPEDKIPYWDFNAPDIPDAPRDVSAAAILASALLELQAYVGMVDSEEYRSVAATLLKNLSLPAYRTTGNEAGGFLLKHGVGHLPQGSEVDVPLSYADYYYVEAMKRYLALKEKE